mgnify:CR=1 FL=1
MREQDRVTLSDSEWIIMQEIWKRGEATFREICDGVAAHQWSKPAVAAFLKRMEKKGAIASAEGGPVKVYRSLLRKETRDIFRRVYGGDVALLAQSLVRSAALDENDMEELIALLRKGREEK